MPRVVTAAGSGGGGGLSERFSNLPKPRLVEAPTVSFRAPVAAVSRAPVKKIIHLGLDKQVRQQNAVQFSSNNRQQLLQANRMRISGGGGPPVRGGFVARGGAQRGGIGASRGGMRGGSATRGARGGAAAFSSSVRGGARGRGGVARGGARGGAGVVARGGRGRGAGRGGRGGRGGAGAGKVLTAEELDAELDSYHGKDPTIEKSAKDMGALDDDMDAYWGAAKKAEEPTE